MRILWVSNGMHTPSSYGQQTFYLLNGIKQLGHEVALLAWPGLQGGRVDMGGIPVFPGSEQPYSQNTVALRAKQFQADVVVSFMDAFAVNPAVYPGLRHISYFPVDTNILRPGDIPTLQQSWDRICFSKDGQEKANTAGLNSDYIPLSVDTETFRPVDRAACRASLKDAGTGEGLPADALIFGVVAVNTEQWPTRKGWHAIFEAFAHFKANYAGQTLLYCHAPVIGGFDSVNLQALAARFGITESVLFSSSEELLDGFAPHRMASLYNAFDCLIMASTGEGCGLPLLEAQSCGIPVVSGGWTGMGEHVFAGVRIREEHAQLTPAPGNHNEGVFRYSVDPVQLARALLRFSELTPDERSEYSAIARQSVVERHSIPTVINQWGVKIQEWAGRIAAETKPPRRVPAANLNSDFQNKVHRAQVTEADIVFVTPSYGEMCGIAEYTGHQVWELFQAGVKAHIATTIAEAVQVALQTPSVKSVIVHHEYSLYDDGNPYLCQGEKTPDFLRQLKGLMQTRPDLKVGIVLHTVVSDPAYAARNQILASSGIPLYSTSLGGATYLSQSTGCPVLHCPLGTWSVAGDDGLPDESPYDYWTIGNFGMLGSSRDIPAHIELCARTGSAMLGSFAFPYGITDTESAKSLRNAIDKAQIPAQIWHDWPDDREILKRLRHSHVLFMPRAVGPYYYQSASVISALNARRPIIANDNPGYSDLADVLCIASTMDEACAWVERLKDPAEYAAAVARIDNYRKQRGIATVYREAGLI